MTTLLTAPIRDLEQRIIGAFADIESWFRDTFAQIPPLFYSSVDLRNNGHKIAPVDTNVFPGGFNNLSTVSYPLVTAALRQQMSWLKSDDTVLLIPENHTRNLAYLDNVAVLRHLFELAGVDVQLGRLDGDATTLKTQSGATISMLPVEREGNSLRCGGIEPSLVVLNNDLSGGLPPILCDVSVPITPPVMMGWGTRRKSSHFYQYQRVAEDLAVLLNTDEWLLSANFSVCQKVNFHRREGMECLAQSVEETLKQISEKYRQYGVKDDPFVILKADAGTYGMGIMSVRHADEVFNLNRRQRNKMSTGKEGSAIRDILIQEGVNTLDDVNGAPAEPVVYMVGDCVAGGFYRANKTRGRDENLNSYGMSFTPLPFQTTCALPIGAGNDTNHRLYVYGVIARLAGVAAARERAMVD